MRKYKVLIMLRYSLIFLVLSLVCGALGFTGVAAAAAGISKVLFWFFLVLFIISLMLHLVKWVPNATLE
jgi:uncharacterized membrane protein YtjA (UPF0391 family)